MSYHLRILHPVLTGFRLLIKATEIFNQALSEEIGNGMTPFIAVGRYDRASRIPTLAHKVKSRDPNAIDEVAELIAPIIPKNAVLVPAPSHNGRATDMLDLARAIAKRTGSEVVDVLTSEPRDSQYETKKRGGLIASQDMGITMTGTLPEGKIPVVIDNVVGSGNTAEACVRAIGKGLVVSLGDAADRYNHAVSLKSAAPILRDRNNNIVPLSKRFELGGSQYLGRSAYERADGKAARVSAKERKLRDAIVDLLRKAGIDVVTESEEGQRVLDMDREHQAKLMGSKVERRKKEIAETLQGKELDQKQKAVVDVFTGESDNESFIVTDKSGKERNIKMRQGNELKAGTKHSIYRHYGTTSNGYNADELLFIPEVIEKGDRKQDSGKGVSYTLKKGDVTYTVTTEISGKGEQFTNFFTDKKPTIAEQGTSNTDNQHVQPQMSAHNSSAKLQKVSEIDEERTKKIFETAKNLFGTTFDIREAGYILPDGSLLDFSGRHLLEGADDKFLRGRRTSDHREIVSIEYERDGFTETGVKTDMSDFIRRGAIRIDVNAGAINLSVKPTKEQRDALQRLIERNDGDVQVDFGDGWDTDHYVEYANAKSNRILNDINRYFDENIKPTGNIKFFRTESGEAYGFTMGGKIYLDPKIATAETPFHEYTHLWAAALRQANPKAWEQLKSELTKDTELMGYVQRLYPELAGSNGANGSNGLSDELAEEVFAHFSGRRGAERLREEQLKAMDEASDYVEKAGVVAMFERLRDALKKFWNMARDLFAGKTRGIKSRSAEDFADMVLADLVGGFKPDRVDSFNKRNADIRYQRGGDVEAVKDNVLREFEAAKKGNAEGRRIPIGSLTKAGRDYLEKLSGLSMKPKVDFILNASDLRHIYNDHYGENEKDKGNNIPLTDEDIRSMVDVITIPDKVVFGVEKDTNRRMFYFFKKNENGTYNLAEVYSDRHGNLTAKTYFNTKRTINQRVNDLNKSQTLTSVTGGASSFSDAKIPKLFDIAEKNVENSTDSDVRFRGEDEPVFYSNAMRAVENIKQERATPEQWVKMIEKQGGLKAGEDKWLGLSEWLKGSEAKTLTKGEVLDYIRANEIQVEEVEYDEYLWEEQGGEIHLRGKDAFYKWNKDKGVYEAYLNGKYYGDYDSQADVEDDILEQYETNQLINETRLSYTTKGLDNKREIAFVVPTVERYEDDDIHFGELGGQAIMWVRFGETTDAYGKAAKVSAKERKLRDAIVDLLRKAGIDVVTESEEGQRVMNMARSLGIAVNDMRRNKKSTSETAVPGEETPFKAAVVSEIDAAKIAKNLDSLIKKTQNLSNEQKKHFISEVAKVLGARKYGSNSEYVTFETKNGEVTLRLADHNAKVSNFDYSGRENGISIVISRKPNTGIENDGNAHIVEYFYPDKALKKADNSPYSEIVRSIQQMLYSGEYKDTTGLAQRQEVNAEQLRMHRVYHGSGADFERFDHSHMGEGEGAQAFGWGTYVTEVEGIGKKYANDAVGKYSPYQKVEYVGEKTDTDSLSHAKAIAPLFNGGSRDWNGVLEFLEQTKESPRTQRHIEWFKKTRPEDWKSANDGKRTLYTVEIPEDNGSNYLEWDKKASDKQTEAIKSALMQNEAFRTNLRNEYDSRNEWTDKPPFEEWLENVASVTSMYGKENGKRLYNELSNMMGSEQAASEFLHSAGFVGIKYPAIYLT